VKNKLNIRKKNRVMQNKPDMYYRFLSDEEPTDEQLAYLMQEVRDKVIEENSKIQQIINDNILHEYENTKKRFPNL